MGDRTSVVLTVLTAQAEACKAFIGEHYEEEIQEEFTIRSFDEVNYGVLDGLSELRELGIAYDSEWGQGSEYCSGCESCRFTPEGEIVILTVADDDINPPIDRLLALIDDAEGLRKYILKHKENTTALPWDSQEAYGKLYRATQLISSKG